MYYIKKNASKFERFEESNCFSRILRQICYHLLTKIFHTQKKSDYSEVRHYQLASRCKKNVGLGLFLRTIFLQSFKIGLFSFFFGILRMYLFFIPKRNSPRKPGGLLQLIGQALSYWLSASGYCWRFY